MVISLKGILLHGINHVQECIGNQMHFIILRKESESSQVILTQILNVWLILLPGM